MIKFLEYLLLYILLMPILTFLHELGHAIVAILYTNDEVLIQIGNGTLDYNIKIRRLYIKFAGYKSLIQVAYGQVIWKNECTKFRKIIITAAGPVVSVLVFLLSTIILYKFYYSLNYKYTIILRSISFYSLIQFLITAIPLKYKFYPYKYMTSDGYKIVELIIKK
ncbi:hypothetical protein SDC9_60569 [bioreactor metagenome]|uniref:Peptidase M50 domain-containing protein n=1 Tax=bioreactor metagenome TaxID=1076179 RepID=A0A644XDN4_9ZZZZ